MNKRSFFIIIFIITIVLTGGLALSNGTNFISRKVAVSSPSSLVDAKVWVGTAIKEIHIPLLFMYTEFTRPFHLYFMLADDNFKFNVVDIYSVNIEYANRESSNIEVNWKRQFETYSYPIATEEGIVYTNRWQVEGYVLDNIEILPHDAKLTITGTLIEQDGSTVPLEITMEFRVEKFWRISTVWRVYASC